MAKSRTVLSPSVGVPAAPPNAVPVESHGPATFPPSPKTAPRIEPRHTHTPPRHIPTPGHAARVQAEIGRKGPGNTNLGSPLGGL